MSFLQPLAARPLMGMALIVIAELALVGGLRAFDLHIGLPASLAVVILLLIPTMWLGCLYWRRIDEAAREAQKAAWFWGGSLGMGAGLIGVGLFARLGLAAADTKPAMALVYGAMAVVLAQLTGFVVAWALWWAAKR
jgi:hypothetical protein